MSLTWDIRECDPTLMEDDARPLVEALVMSTMSVGIGHWTEANAPEVYARLHLLEDLYGPFLRHVEDGVVSDRPITPEDVRRFVGLRTNVAPTESRSSFLKRHAAYQLDQSVRAYRKAVEAAATA